MQSSSISGITFALVTLNMKENFSLHELVLALSLVLVLYLKGITSASKTKPMGSLPIWPNPSYPSLCNLDLQNVLLFGELF